jgi:hypothetical protein
MLAVGNDEQKGQPDVKEGDIICYLHQGEWLEAPLEYGKESIYPNPAVKTNTLGYITKADGAHRVVSLDGKLLKDDNVRLKQ